jgi:S-adenosylmethionine synthetase
MIDTQGTSHVSAEALEVAVRQVFRLTPSGIIAMLDLARPIYRQTAAYGHFGRGDIALSWERTDQIEALKSALMKPLRYKAVEQNTLSSP